MREQPSNYFFGLDVGTSLVKCVVGAIETGENPARPAVIGHGSSSNLGMRKGVVIHIDDVAQAIAEAVTETERLSGVNINHATVNVNGSHITGVNSRGVIAISASNRDITTDDRLRVEEAATIVKLPTNREIIQVFAKNYRLDGQENIKDPIGMQGVRLEVDTHIVTASTPALRNLDQALEKANIAPDHHTVSSLAASEAVMERQQKEAGTVLLDIGAGTTNLVVLEDGEVQHVAVLPMGGMHITNDLAIGLRTDLDIAEAVKLQHGGLGKHKKTSRVAVGSGQNRHDFDGTEVHMIVEARVDELMEYVDKELKKIQRSRKLPGGVVLVGGSSKLPGLAEFGRDALGLAVRVGKLQPLGGLLDTVNDPTYFTAVGLMLLDMLLAPAESPLKGTPNTNVFRVIDGLYRRIRRQR
jgi:cell division protein FtsA